MSSTAACCSMPSTTATITSVAGEASKKKTKKRASSTKSRKTKDDDCTVDISSVYKKKKRSTKKSTEESGASAAPKTSKKKRKRQEEEEEEHEEDQEPEMEGTGSDEGGEEKKKRKKPTNPDKIAYSNRVREIPKAVTAFILFSQERHRKLAESGQKTSRDFGENSRDTRDAWHGLSDKERKPFLDQAEIDRDRYALEKSKILVPPKRYLNAYLFFAREKNSGNPAAKPNKEWATMSPEAKEPYNVMSRKDKERYEAEVKNWEETRPQRIASGYYLPCSKPQKKKKKRKVAATESASS